MRLHSIEIEGYRRLKDVKISFGEATFLIGENNVGKSSVLKAIDLLLSGSDKIEENDFCMLFDHDEQRNKRVSDEVRIKAEFYNVSPEIKEFRGFNDHRLLKYDNTNQFQDESGFKVVFRKTYTLSDKAKFELLTYKRTLKPEFENCNTPNELVSKGLSEEVVRLSFEEDTWDKKLTTKVKKEKFRQIEELWSVDRSEEVWDNNPGGIIGNVISQLPQFLLIPAQLSDNEIDHKSGALHKILNELFREIREQSENYKMAAQFLHKLSQEMDASDEASEYGKLMNDLNTVLDSVFPMSKIFAEADLSDPDSALKPLFNVELSSNVRTSVANQGTGMVRSVVFALLKYRESWLQKKRKNDSQRTMIIGFEEPEIYLHPNASNQMRNTLYGLASNTTQIICSTHSPHMIDLSRKPKQVLNKLAITGRFTTNNAFSMGQKFMTLQADDQSYIKMLQRIDDQVARVFFAKKVIVVEGDTDEIILRKTIDLLPASKKAIADIQIVKARGKAIIISFVKYLKSMGIDPFVIHDKDGNTPNAQQFNQPILEAFGSETNRVMMEQCIEDELGYPPPTANKPFKAYQFAERWKAWDDISPSWKDKVYKVIGEYFDE